MRKWILMAVATVVLGAIVLGVLLGRQSADAEISSEQAAAKVTDIYGGKVEETQVSDKHYQVEFVREGGTYTALVNKKTGQIENMELNEKAGAPAKLSSKEASAIASNEVAGEVENVSYVKEANEYEVKIITKDPKKQSTVFIAADTGKVRDIVDKAVEESPPLKEEPVISEQEAIEIAKKTLDGEVGDVEFVETEDGGYYLVDIENEATEQEVLVQVHAIRGDTMTVEWDD